MLVELIVEFTVDALSEFSTDVPANASVAKSIVAFPGFAAANLISLSVLSVVWMIFSSCCRVSPRSFMTVSLWSC